MKRWVKGRVRWFNNLSGEGIIRVGNNSKRVHWSSIANGLSNPKIVWYILFKNQRVKVLLEFDQVVKVKTEKRIL